MSKFKIVNLIDKIFITSSLFLLSFSWVNFYLRDLWLSFLLSIILSLGESYVLFYFFEKKYDKKLLSQKLQLNIEDTFIAFKLLPLEERINTIIKTIPHSTIEIRANTIEYSDNQKHNLLILATDYISLSQNDLENILSNIDYKKYSKITIIAKEKGKLKLDFLRSIQLEIIDKVKLYNLLDDNHISLDLSIINHDSNKLSIKEIAKNFFVKEKAKSFFICGLILLFSSIILPYHIYYLLFGSLLIVFSLVCRMTIYIERA